MGALRTQSAPSTDCDLKNRQVLPSVGAMRLTRLGWGQRASNQGPIGRLAGSTVRGNSSRASSEGL
jgi:hypothetical protein